MMASFLRRAGRSSRRALRPCLIASIAALADPALGDVVRMKSGDVISGEIEHISDDELVIDPPFADPIEIDVKYIAAIQTDRPVKVTFKDGRETTGLVELDAYGKMRVRVTASRWETEHEDDPWILRRNRESVPVSGTEVALERLKDVQDLEVAYYRYEAELSLGLNAATGNTESSAFDFDASLEPVWGPNSLHLEGGIDKRTSNGELDAKNWRTKLQYERELPGKWYAYLVNFNESDPFQNLDLRLAVGSGAGYRFYDADPTHLSISLGAGYVRENFSAPSPDRDFPGALWYFVAEREFFGDDITLYHNHLLIKALTNKQLVLSSTQGLKLDLFSDLDLKLEVQYDHTSDPAPGGLQKDDLRYVLKLDFSFEGDETDWLH